MVNTGIGTLVGVGMMGATASMVNAMPAGTAKTITGIVPGLQATTLVGYNLKAVNQTMGKQPKMKAKKGKKMIW